MENITIPSVLLSKKEYDDLIHPDRTYSFMTKTAAIQLRKQLLKHENFHCWHDKDRDEMDEPVVCDNCPMYTIFTDDLTDRLCTLQKRFYHDVY